MEIMRFMYHQHLYQGYRFFFGRSGVSGEYVGGVPNSDSCNNWLFRVETIKSNAQNISGCIGPDERSRYFDWGLQT